MPGPFDSLSDAHLLNDAYQAITTAEAWDYIRDFDGPKGFMFSNDARLQDIRKHMTTMDLHSGASYAFVMRAMQYVAKFGIDAFLAEQR